MGGRGTFAAGNNVVYTYETVGKIEGVKVLEPIDKSRSHNIPPEAHSSSSYIVLDRKNGVFRQYIEYNKNHLPVFEIGYHFESGMSKAGESVLHIHEYGSPGIENRGKPRLLTPTEYNKYKKYFKGVK